MPLNAFGHGANPEQIKVMATVMFKKVHAVLKLRPVSYYASSTIRKDVDQNITIWQKLSNYYKYVHAGGSPEEPISLYVASDRKSIIKHLLPLTGITSTRKVTVISNLALLSNLKRANYPCTLLVDMESFDDLVTIIDFLLQFRTQHPSIPVIIASENFQFNSSGDERKAICDYSLKIPCQIYSLREAIKGAHTHRQHYNP